MGEDTVVSIHSQSQGNSTSFERHAPTFARVYMREKQLLLEMLREGDETLHARAGDIVANFLAGGNRGVPANRPQNRTNDMKNPDQQSEHLKKLESLGAKRPATTLLALAPVSDEAANAIERLIASPTQNLKRVKARLAALHRNSGSPIRRRRFVSRHPTRIS